jgi:hypothetical protein
MRRRRFARALFSLAWLGMLGLALRTGATAYGVTPEQLLGLLVSSYLGIWGLVFFLSRQGRTVDAARFTMVTGSILLAVALIEAPSALGLVDYRSVFRIPTPTWRRPGYRPDPELVYVREGDRQTRWSCVGSELYTLRGASPTTIYHCDLRLDRDGFRNPPGLDAPDVAVVGDSFIEGVHVGESELITARLTRLTGLAVANLGRTGYGPDQALIVLRRHALGKAQTCVWAFYEGNGLQDLHEFEAYQKDLPRILRSRGGESLHDRGFVRNALLFAIESWLRPAPRRPTRAFTGRFRGDSNRKVPIYFGSGIQHGDGAPALPREGSPELRQVVSMLAEVHAICRRQGSELIVLFISSRFRVYRDLCAFEPDSPCRSWPVDDLPGALGAAVAADLPGVRFLDLTLHFRAEAAAGALLYMADDNHWSPPGHQVASEELAPLLCRPARLAQDRGHHPDAAPGLRAEVGSRPAPAGVERTVTGDAGTVR